MMLLRTLPTPLLRTLKKTLTRCIKLAYVQEHGSPCPPYLSKIWDLSILPRILQVEAPWWNLTIDQVAELFQQEPEDCYQLFAWDTRTIDAIVMKSIGRSILQYRHTIRQDLPFRLKRLHVWNVSGWTLLQHGFQAAWFGGLRIATTSSAAGATARIAVVVQTGCGFLSGAQGNCFHICWKFGERMYSVLNHLEPTWTSLTYLGTMYVQVNS